MAAYKDCVYSRAIEITAVTATPEDTARVAAAQCQGNLAIITDKLREENAWHEHYGSNADGYSEALRERTIAEVAADIKEKRGN